MTPTILLAAALAWAQPAPAEPGPVGDPIPEVEPETPPEVEPEEVPDAAEDDDEPDPVDPLETALPEPEDTPLPDRGPTPLRDDVPPLMPDEETGLIPEPIPTVEDAVIEPQAVPQAGVEITVFGPAAIREARDAIVAEMRDMGYRPVDKGGGRYVFRPPERWMGRVRLEPDGQIVFQRPVVALRNVHAHERQRENEIVTPPGIEANPNISRTPSGNVITRGDYGDESLMLPPAEGTFYFLPSMRLLTPIREAVMQRLEPKLEAYRQVRRNTVRMERLDEVRAELSRLWELGEPLQGTGGTLQTWEDRRRAALAFWASRLPNAEGLAVTELVEQWLMNVVMTSDHPVTEEEVRWAEAQRPDSRPLRIGVFSLEDEAAPPEPGEAAPPEEEAVPAPEEGAPSGEEAAPEPEGEAAPLEE